MSSSPISALVDIIATQAKALEAKYAKENVVAPPLDEPFKSSPLDTDVEIGQSADLIIAAAFQLIATVRDPFKTIQDYSQSMYLSATVAYVTDINVPEILATAGAHGMHAKDIAAASGGDEVKISRILRYLASRHLFKEVTPDVYANNRLSSYLIKANGKSVQELQKSPETKYDESGAAAFVGHTAEEGLKASAHMSDWLRSGGKTAAAPFNLGFGTDKNLWNWYQSEGNVWRFTRFISAMKSGGQALGDSLFTRDDIWSSLTEEDVAVDVGGHIGLVTSAISKVFPKPKFVVQDLPHVIAGDAKGFWEATNPDAIKSGKVTLQAHDFFQPQPVKGAAIYFLRFILHDWNTPKCIEILTRVREAAKPTSKLILFEFCVPYACEYERPVGVKINYESVPYPLIANAKHGRHTTFVDMQMMNFFDGQERSLHEFADLGKQTGWKLESVRNEDVTALIFSAV